MRATYDGTYAAYIYLREIERGGVDYSVMVDLGGPDDRPRLGSITLDFDKDDRLIGIEVLSAKDILPWEVLVAAAPPGD